MITLIKYIIYFLVLNVVLNAIFQFNPILGYIVYFGFLIYWFRGFRLRSRRNSTFHQSQYQQQTPEYEEPKTKNMDDVIDVEYTEHEEK